MNPTARNRSETDDSPPADDSPQSDASPPTVVGVAGPSGAGKTALVERLVGAFAAEGQRVATVKSIHHAIEPDDPGTDTHRHRTAGAAATVGITPRHTFEISPHDPDEGDSNEGAVSDEGDSNEEADSDEEDDPGGSGDIDTRKRAAFRDAIDRFAAAGHDLVIVEGFTGVPIPTILVGDTDSETVAGEIVAEDDDPFDAVREAVRAVDPPESLGRPETAESNATDIHNR